MLKEDALQKACPFANMRNGHLMKCLADGCMGWVPFRIAAARFEGGGVKERKDDPDNGYCDLMPKELEVNL